MKNILALLFLLGITQSSFSQSSENRFNFTAGGGPQRYSGDLGNGFHHKRPCWYGGVGVTASVFLNRSFDIGYFGFVGDFSYDQPKEVEDVIVDKNQQCVGCFDRVGLGNLKSRLTNSGLFLRYKIGNNCKLLAGNNIHPYVYLGAGYNFVSDRMKMNCVNEGYYFSLNGGLGLKYYVSERLNFSYNLAIGYFTDDKMDNLSSGIGDMYMQNSLNIGIDLF